MESVANNSTSVRRYRRCSYKIRCFYSKGAFLVIFWTFLFTLSLAYMIQNVSLYIEIVRYKSTLFWISIASIPLFVFCAPIIGWIADTRCGNYRVFRTGTILVLLATVVACLTWVIFQSVLPIPAFMSCTLISQVSGYARLIVYIIAFVGAIACVITALQLGLDQMPDASSANITSFIAWFVFVIVCGIWLVFSMSNLMFCNMFTFNSIFFDKLRSSWFSGFLNIFPVALMSIICCSLFLLGPKWLIIEPNCPQSLKTIYQVLKFAWKHKSPLNRSALTYWEEDIPSRMDLGKSRYGGPFTTEQVEDVKTFFKIIIIILAISLSISSLYPRFVFKLLQTTFICYETLFIAFMNSPIWVMIVTHLVYEFVVYPLFKNKLPSLLKRIGFFLLLALIFKSAELVIIVLDTSKVMQWFDLVNSLSLQCVWVLLITNILEFVCAQSPYKMRGLLLGCVLFLGIISLSSTWSIIFFLMYFKVNFSIILLNSVFTALSLLGFVAYCLVARWYKMRVRDEEYNVHRGVEEVYDRYLSQRP